MKQLWAPWRMEYIRTASKECRSGRKRCLFCTLAASKKDENDLILYRGELGFVVMNRYPYNNGHLMAAPYRHVGDLEKLLPTEAQELFELVQASMRVLRTDMKPHGYNVGMNLGRVAGAGVKDHLHVHVVPRWRGDVNYMPVIAETRVVSEHLGETWQRLKNRFEGRG